MQTISMEKATVTVLPSSTLHVQDNPITLCAYRYNYVPN